MKHLSWKYRRRRTPQEMREFREKQRQRIQQRWARVHAACAGEPVRASRIVEFPIRDTHRPFAMIRLEAEPTERGFGRWLVSENGVRVGKRRFGRRQVADMIARWLS
jgi:hypothetical protein